MSTYIIAEMAWSHTGSLERALEMLEGAKRAGADAISIHVTDMPTYMVEDYKCIAGTTLSDSADQQATIYNFLDKINLSHEQWSLFDERAKRLGIDLVVMCNDRVSFEFSKSLSVCRYVISPASFLESHLIEDIVRCNSDIILRTGGATLDEVADVVGRILKADPSSRICLLAGIQLYPTPIEELHLASLRAIAVQFGQSGVSIGLADHIDGDHPYAIYLPALALAFGAKVLEKHITTHRQEKLEDYEAALGIEQFTHFVDYVRTAERALGSGSLDYMADNSSYQKYRLVARKKVVAAIDLAAGTVLTPEMLSFKRADNGAPLDILDQLIGRPLREKKRRDEGVDVTDVSTST
jgi:N,N'-diacetyllegionaminate synthase